MTNRIPAELEGIRVEVPSNIPVMLIRETGGERRVIPIYIGESEASAISVALNGVIPDRPLTHDLMGLVFQGFGIELERVVITSLKNSTFFARLILRQQNELGTKLVEIDARPSDCLALASALKRPIFVTRSLFHDVEDMSDHLAGANEQEDLGEEDSEEPGEQA
jgi:bifunctional DNase/RNase